MYTRKKMSHKAGVIGSIKLSNKGSRNQTLQDNQTLNKNYFHSNGIGFKDDCNRE